jgi:hypothetical protein
MSGSPFFSTTDVAMMNTIIYGKYLSNLELDSDEFNIKLNDKTAMNDYITTLQTNNTYNTEFTNLFKKLLEEMVKEM